MTDLYPGPGGDDEDPVTEQRGGLVPRAGDDGEDLPTVEWRSSQGEVARAPASAPAPEAHVEEEEDEDPTIAYSGESAPTTEGADEESLPTAEWRSVQVEVAPAPAPHVVVRPPDRPAPAATTFLVDRRLTSTLSATVGEIGPRPRPRARYAVIVIATLVTLGLFASLFAGTDWWREVADKSPIDPMAARRRATAKHAAKARSVATAAPGIAVTTPLRHPPDAGRRASRPAAPAKRRIRVTARPGGAEVLCDGRSLGASPIEAATIPTGRVVLLTRKPGYLDDRRIIEPGTGAVQLHFVLAPKPLASMKVFTKCGNKPLWADVFLDGKPVGQSPVLLERIAAGTHRIEGRRDGYRPALRRVLLEPGRTRTLVLSLEAVVPATPEVKQTDEDEE